MSVGRPAVIGAGVAVSEDFAAGFRNEIGQTEIESLLLGELIARCEAGPWRQMIAIIGDSGNAASIALHRRFGFEPTGTLRSVGLKFGRWVDTPFMQRALGPGDHDLPSSPS
jgi:L-amino acid N-acyltransferase YncA